MTLDTFVNLSVILTGYPKSKIQPQNDTQKLSEAYFAVVNKEVPPALLEELNSAFLSLNPATETNVQSQIVNTNHLGPGVKNILKMWYLGAWYSLNTSATPSLEDSYIVSSIAYKNGLVWSTMNAHPMGYSEENFGYWNTAPNNTGS
jgi:hypothetical protein